VSRALNGTGRVSDETRLRILTAAEHLGYRPSPLARGFRAGTTSTLGLVVGSLAEPGTADFVSGLTESAEQAGYSVIIAESGPGNRSTPILDFPIDGVVMLRGTQAEHRRALRGRGIPFVDARRCATSVNEPGDEYATALEAYRGLVRLGHQRIGTIELASDAADERHANRRDAADRAIQESPLHAVDEASVLSVEVAGPAEAYAAVTAMLVDQVVSAISVGSDLLIAPVLRAFTDARVPLGTGVSLLAVAHGAATLDMHPTLGFLAHDSRSDGQRTAHHVLTELGRGDGSVALPAPEGHWQFLQRASITTSSIVPNC
jgi:LacI family transcriptional regulator